MRLSSAPSLFRLALFAALLSSSLSTGCQLGYMSEQPANEQNAEPDDNTDSGDEEEPVAEIDPGTVTLHRLNRAEYNNTVRDLLGTELRPADEFPEDDFGYGFNNVADVLSISPLLFDRYMQAADNLVAEVLAGHRPQAGQTLHHEEAEDLGGSVGAAQGDYWNLWSNGEVSTIAEFSYDGEYTLAVRAYGNQAGPEPARMEVRLDGQVLETIDVTAEANAPQTYRVTRQIDAGRRVVSAAFINDYYMPDAGEDRNLYIDWIEVAAVPSDSEAADEIFVCEPADGQELECARQILDGFATRAWRRPVTDAEVDKLVGVVEESMNAGDDFRAAVGLALKATLVSPHFVFRVEKDPQDEPHRLNQYELASRLSYFLWSSMPDRTLFELAEAGELDDDTVLREQVARMLDSPKARALVNNFASQWLEIDAVDNADPDYEYFPDFDDSLRAAMKQETRRFVKGFFDEDRPLDELLTAEYTFVNGRLATHYGIDGVESSEFERVELAGEERGGLLTHASILTATSYPKRTSPVQRGKWVLGQLLCKEPPPPPPEVENIDEEAQSQGQTLREIMERHASEPACATCHKMMDPIGFGMSNYDAIGAWRDTENGQQVDASGTLPDGRSFHGALELSRIISADPGYERCVSRKVLTYALGRGVESQDDEKIIDTVVERAKANGGTMREFITQVVLSRAFRLRRAERPDEISDTQASEESDE